MTCCVHRACVCALALLWSSAVQAQNASPGVRSGESVLRVSIWDALRLARRASESVAVARARLNRTRAEQVAARSALYPQVSASASYERTLKTQFDALRPAGDDGGPEALEELPFGRDNTWRVGLAARQSLYAGGRTLAAMRAARSEKQRVQIALGAARAEAVFAAGRAYYDAALSDELVAIAWARLEQAERTLKNTELEYEAQRQPEFEVLRARVEVHRTRPVLVAERMNRELAYLQLKQQLGVPQTLAVSLMTPLEDTALQRIAAQARLAANVRRSALRAPVREALQGVQSRRAERDLAIAGHLPQVSLYTLYERVAYPQDLFPSWDEFRTNWSVGLSLEIALFEGFRTTAAVDVAEARLAEARALLKQARELAMLDSVEARQSLRAAHAVWLSTADSVEQAQRAYELAQLRYEEGVSTSLEVSDARLALAQARVVRARAARDLQVARIRLALLDELPLQRPVPAAPDPGTDAIAEPRATDSAPPRTPAGSVMGSGASGGGFP